MAWIEIEAAMDFLAARRNMVDRQVRTNKVTDEAVLEALRQVPRELFVPQSMRSVAYVDEDVPVGNGRYLMEPMVFGRLLQSARIGKGEVVLDIGCGTGYSAAVLSRLANMVVALESEPALTQRGVAALAELGIDNAVLVEGALPEGWPEQAPYGVILLEGSVAQVPDTVLDQLAEGGRLVAVEQQAGFGRAMLFLKRNAIVSSRPLFDAGLPQLPGFTAEPSFVF
jgi:protein-L-isoaspartate(D-aspartate) O-methyltransferase